MKREENKAMRSSGRIISLVLASLLGGSAWAQTGEAEAEAVVTSAPTTAAPVESGTERRTARPRVQGADLLRLDNGDQLVGTLMAASPADGIQWQHGEDLPAARFRFEAVGEVELEAQVPVRRADGSRCLIRCSNGDEIAGQLLGADETEARVETWFGGELRFPRDRWQWIVFDDEPVEPLYSGPQGLEGWTIGDVSMARVQSGDWVYHEGAFYATKAASIARNLDLPDRSRIEFNLHWKGTLNLAFALYTDYLHPVSLANKDTEPDFGGFYSLQLNSYFANVLMVKQKVPLQYLGQVQTPAFAKKRKAHIDIRVDKAGDSVALLVDGALVKQWVDKTGFAGEGTGVRMVHQGQGAIRFSHFQVFPWNGQFDEAPTIRSTAKEDLVTLRNGDKLIGRVSRIEGGNVEVALLGGPTSLSLQDVKKIEFAGVVDLKTSLPEPAHPISTEFADQGVLHVELTEIRDNLLYGVSPNFGPVELDLSAFRRLRF